MPKDKVIAYFSRYRIGQNASSNNENGIPLVPKNRDNRNVLVDEGNKCVAPAKSRPKKRKTVKPLQLVNKGGDDSPLRTLEVGSPDVAENVLWSDQVYTVRHLVKQFDGQFPVIVRVDEGHYREGVVDLARGQVLLVSDHGKQQRVLARNNSTETLLSLPVDYEMEISVSSSAEVVDFTTTVKEKELPFTATVCSVSPLSDTLHGNLTGETLTFLSIKDTSFLRANSISHGWVDQSEILVLPELVQVQFSVSEGLRGGSEQEWHDYQGMFARCVRHLSFNSMTGYKGILLEGPDENELLLSSTYCLADNDPMTAQSQTLQAAMERKKQRIAYENLRLSVTNQSKESHEENLRLNSEDITEDGVRLVSCSSSTLDYRRPREDRSSKPEPEPMSVTARHDQQRTTCSVVSKTNSEIIQIFDEIVDLNDVDQTFTAAQNVSEASALRNIQPATHNSRHEETRVNIESKRAGDDVKNTSEREDFNQKGSSAAEATGSCKVNVLRRVGKFQSPITTNAADARPSGHPLQRNPEGKSEIRHSDTNDDRAKSLKPTELDKPIEKPKSVIVEKPKPAVVNRIQPPQRPPSTVGDKPTNDDLSRQSNRWQQPQTSVKPLQHSQHKPVISCSSSKPLSQPAHQAAISCSSSKPLSQPAQPPPLSRPPLTSISNPNRISQLQSSSNRKTINDCAPVPSTKSALPTNRVIPVVKRPSVIRDVIIKTSSDVPSQLESLSVAGVGQCLELLHLDKHVTDFSRDAVDGRKLTDLTQKVLEQQFHFTPLDASKLIRFVRGWRP